MASTLRTIAALADAGLVRPDPNLVKVEETYSIAVTPEMAALVDPADPDDPIGRQFLPDSRELERRPDQLDDPIGDDAHAPVKGVVHRYPDRALLKPLLACPVYCRFCFRREAVGPGADALSESELDAAFAYLAATPEIWEVILTGGDPLMLSPRRVATIIQKLEAIDHVKVVRWHSRVPIVDPDRVTDELAAALRASSKPQWMAVHCNHPRELTGGAAAALRRLAEAGVLLVSQTVLLRGVNDDAAVLEALMRRLVECRVRPYYLHQLDLAPGTEHFRVPISQGQAILRALRGRLSGIAQPTFVLDLPGGFGKVPVGPQFAEDALDGTLQVTDPRGRVHRYPADRSEFND